MKSFPYETTVGLLVILGLACIVYLAVQLGGLTIFGGDALRLEATFSSTSGLKEGAGIYIAGVQVGRVGSIRLDPESMLAEVELLLDPELELSSDSIASIKTTGLIGDKYVSISPGGAMESLADGDRITETEPAVDWESVIAKFAHGSI